MATFKSQVLYGFASDAKPVLIGEGDNKVKTISHDDYVEGLSSAESCIGQLIVQDNAEVTRQNDLIAGQGLASLDGTATLADVIAELNKHLNILTGLNLESKQ